tara:strand:+ start:381 stop:818 length:438 start_codon:yes stop_codon:yes gene_type:complete
MIDGKKLKRLRKLKFYNQCELAEKAGVSQSLLSRLERNEVKFPRFIPLEKLAIALEDTSFLYATNEEEHQKQTSAEKASFMSDHLSKLTANDVDDRVCMHYVVDRLDELIETVDPAKVQKRLCDFKQELVYNLGVNTRIKRKGED